MKVGLVGVGTMGSRMLGALVKAGHEVYCRDIDPAAEQRVRDLGGVVVNSPKEVARNASIVLLSLPLPEDVEEVVCRPADGILSAAKPGHIIIDLSTVDPSSTQRNFALAKKQGVGYLDAPVLGRPHRVGNWTLPTGGEEAVLERSREVLGALASRVLYIGPSGWGNIIKLLNNMMFGAINGVICEIMALCAEVGMPPKVLFDTISQSGAATVSNLFLELGPKILSRDFEPAFSVDLLYKDLMLGIRMANEHNAPTFMTSSAQLLNQMARAKGLGKKDTCSAVKIWEDLLGIEVKS